MIIMALDHVRDFFHRDAGAFSPTDLTRTWPALFLTRWITHYCLPVFMLTAGLGIYLRYSRSRQSPSPQSRPQLARFLLTRGLWFLFLELTVMQLAYNFNFARNQLLLLLILWIFGLCMLVMSALIFLPLRALAALSIAIVLFHNTLDGINAARFGPLAWLWNLVHQPGVIVLAGKPVLITYNLLPWIGVMAGGFSLGRLYELDSARRQRILLRLGLVMVAAFFILRAVNHYGDPAPWSTQRTPLLTALSFLNCTKYPGSLDFLLMTLGPALLVLRALDTRSFRAANPVLVFGRVPMFYFIVHFYAIHVLLAIMTWIRYGRHAFAFIFHPPPAMGGPQQIFPTSFGYSLLSVYLVWIALVVALYPLCRSYAQAKTGRQQWWWSYL